MKKIFLFLLVILTTQLIYCQKIPQLKLTVNGVEPIVVKTQDLNKTAIYNKTLAWVNTNYLDPKNAIKENSVNTKIKVEGFKRRAWYYKSMGIKNYNHMLYTIEVVCNDGDFEFNYLIGDFFIDEGQSAQYDYKMFFKKDGSVRKQYIEAIPSIEKTMNELLISLYNYITDKSIKLSDLTSNTNYINELKELAELKEKGIITEKEFNDLKAKILTRVKNE